MTPIINSPSSSSAISLEPERHKSTHNNRRRRHCQRRCGDASVFAMTTDMSNHSKWLLTFLLLGLFVVAASAANEKKSTETKTVQSSPESLPSASSSSVVAAAHRDEIYIDDENIEGSGGRGQLHDDLDPDYSGSGFGPDDEDSSTDHHNKHYRKPSIETQSGNSKQNTNDNNDLITSRTHQTNSGTITGSGTSGNSGFIGSGNTGLNTIGKDHTSTSTSSSSIPTTTTITTTQTNSTPSLYTPIHTNISPSSPLSPTHTDDDDFDLDETIGGGSGDGNHPDDDDDDNTGDIDDNDDDLDIIGRDNQSVLGGGAATSSTHKIDKTNDDDISTDVNSNKDNIDHSSKEDHLGSNIDNNFDEDGAQTNFNEHDDNDDSEEGDDDEGTEIYTDVTDPSSSNNNNSGESSQTRPGINNQGTIHELDTNNINSLPPETKVVEHTTGNEVLIMNTGEDDRTTSFFAQPGILAAVIGGAVVGLLCAILVVMFIVYRMRKKDEGSYALDEPKRSPAVNSYAKNANNREFYA